MFVDKKTGEVLTYAQLQKHPAMLSDEWTIGWPADHTVVGVDELIEGKFERVIPVKAPERGDEEVVYADGAEKLGGKWFQKWASRPKTKEELSGEKRADILLKISDLEMQQTPRRLREAALSAEGLKWLQDLDAEINKLRAELEA